MNEEEWIFDQVSRFYDLAREDILIGYHFRNVKDFDEHIPRIASFWDLQLLGHTSRKVEGQFDIIKAHVPLGIKRGELGRWLVLFRKVLDETTEHQDLKALWLQRLVSFERSFTRFFGLQTGGHESF